MSAFPSIATVQRTSRLVRFVPIGELSKASIIASMPVATRGRPTKGRLRWPPSKELCLSRKLANDGSVVGRSKLASFDHLVGADKHRWWDCEAERLRSLQIKNELEPGRLHDGKVCRLGTFENLAGIDADLMI
jgi:hypothetical protein